MNDRVGAPISRARGFQEGEDGGVDADAEGGRRSVYKIANDGAIPLNSAPVSIPSKTRALNAWSAFE